MKDLNVYTEKLKAGSGVEEFSEDEIKEFIKLVLIQDEFKNIDFKSAWVWSKSCDLTIKEKKDGKLAPTNLNRIEKAVHEGFHEASMICDSITQTMNGCEFENLKGYKYSINNETIITEINKDLIKPQEVLIMEDKLEGFEYFSMTFVNTYIKNKNACYESIIQEYYAYTLSVMASKIYDQYEKDNHIECQEERCDGTIRWYEIMTTSFRLIIENYIKANLKKEDREYIKRNEFLKIINHCDRINRKYCKNYFIF